MSDKTVTVRVAQHAIQRARMRFPDLRAMQPGEVHTQLHNEAVKAIGDGKLTSTPRLNGGRRVKSRRSSVKRLHPGTHRYAQTNDGRELVLVSKGKNVWLVVTVIGAAQNAEAA